MDILADILNEENQPTSARSNGNQDDDDDDLYDSSLMMNEETEEVDDHVPEEQEDDTKIDVQPEALRNESTEQRNEQIEHTLSRDDDTDNTRYFTVKATTHDEVAKSYESNVWNLSATAKHKVSQALNEKATVVLIVTISGSRNFQGYMKVSVSSLEVEDSSASQAVQVVWKKLCHLSYNSTTSIKNSLNDNQSVKLCRDGQELDQASALKLIDLMLSLPDESLASQKEKLSQGILLTPAASTPHVENIHHVDEKEHEPDEKRPRKNSEDKLWYERVKPNANVQHLLQEHAYLNEMDVTNMSYDEYLERFRMMQARAQEQFQMSFMPPPGYFPPMMPMGMPPPMFGQPGYGGFPRGPPRGNF